MAISLPPTGADSEVLFTDWRLIQVADISPNIVIESQVYFKAFVVLVWPYSSSTQNLSLLLADPSAQLHKTQGQVKVNFHNGAAQEVAKLQCGIGDVLRLALDGAHLVETGQNVSTPGKKVRWDLDFGRSVKLDAQRHGVSLGSVDFVSPVSNGSSKSDAPRSSQPGLNTASPKSALHKPITTLVTPARSQSHFRLSQPFLDTSLEYFYQEEDDQSQRRRKRTKFARHSGGWNLLDEDKRQPDDRDGSLKTPAEVVEVVDTHNTQVLDTRFSVLVEQSTPQSDVSRLSSPLPDDRQGSNTSPLEVPSLGLEENVAVLADSMPPPMTPVRKTSTTLHLQTGAIDSIGTVTPPNVLTPRLVPLPSPDLPLISPFPELRVNLWNQTTDSSEFDQSSAKDRVPEQSTIDLVLNFIPEIVPNHSGGRSDVIDLSSPLIEVSEKSFRPPVEETIQEPLQDLGPKVTEAPVSQSAQVQEAFPLQVENSGLYNETDNVLSFSHLTHIGDIPPGLSTGEALLTPYNVLTHQERNLLEHNAAENSSSAVENFLNTFSPYLSPQNPSKQEHMPELELQTTGTSLHMTADKTVVPEWSHREQSWLPSYDSDLVMLHQPEPPILQEGVPLAVQLSTSLDLNQNLATSVITESGELEAFKGAVDEAMSQSQLADPFEPKRPSHTLPMPTVESAAALPERSQTQLFPLPFQTWQSGDEFVTDPSAQSDIVRSDATLVVPDHHVLPTPMNTQNGPHSSQPASDLQSVQCKETPCLASTITRPSNFETEFVDRSPPLTPQSARRLPQDDFENRIQTEDNLRLPISDKLSDDGQGKDSGPDQDRLHNIPEKLSMQDEEPSLMHRSGKIFEADGSTTKVISIPEPIAVKSVSTSLSFFPGLSSLQDYFQQNVDLFVVAASNSSTAERAQSGPKDYFTSIYLADRSIPADCDDGIRAEIFRPVRRALPRVKRGDVLLLRNMKVQTYHGQPRVVSTDSSAWAVFQISQLETDEDSLFSVDISGPPLEYNDDEILVAKTLRFWWLEHGQHRFVEQRQNSTRPMKQKAQDPKRSDHTEDTISHHDEQENGKDPTQMFPTTMTEVATSNQDIEALRSGDEARDLLSPIKSKFSPRPRSNTTESQNHETTREHRRRSSRLSQKTAHELRSGTKYMDDTADGRVARSGTRSRTTSIHELRDGTKWQDR